MIRLLTVLNLLASLILLFMATIGPKIEITMYLMVLYGYPILLVNLLVGFVTSIWLAILHARRANKV